MSRYLPVDATTVYRMVTTIEEPGKPPQVSAEGPYSTKAAAKAQQTKAQGHWNYNSNNYQSYQYTRMTFEVQEATIEWKTIQ
jgi:hypothetical protein